MTESAGSVERLWDRTRRSVQAEIIQVAMDLFLRKGFEQTTIDEIVAVAGVSRRSFFRYFGTKEDVVLGGLADEGARVRAELAKHPDDEDLWTALRSAILAVGDAEADEERTLAVARMMYGSPSLRARSIEKHLRWQSDLVPEVRRRLGPPEGTADLRAAAVVASVITCLDVAGEAWTRADADRPLAVYFTEALDAVHRR
ncbi:TetR/AcrR family transcriptional regulator [Streptomyces sp. NPDC006175]|uniref:TetR/AcrR family transcriptional regulator n=1 Tax=Streptomyces sp. NPDC006175 TaxID=3154471 RepID=UPI0033B6A937